MSTVKTKKNPRWIPLCPVCGTPTGKEDSCSCTELQQTAYAEGRTPSLLDTPEDWDDNEALILGLS